MGRHYEQGSNMVDIKRVTEEADTEAQADLSVF